MKNTLSGIVYTAVLSALVLVMVGLDYLMSQLFGLPQLLSQFTVVLLSFPAGYFMVVVMDAFFKKLEEN